MKYQQFKLEIQAAIIAILGRFDSKMENVCKKCFNKRMNISDTISKIILNS